MNDRGEPAPDRAARKASILVVDDEATIRDSLRMILEYEGYRVEEAASGREALVKASDRPLNAIVLDVKMPEIDGLEVLRSLRERGVDLPVLVISGHGDIATAVEATRRGAFDFLEKPLQRDRVLLALRNAVETDRLQRENRRLRPEPEELIGESAPMRELRRTIDRAAPTTATVLITGESGTGKELVARALHRASQRHSHPLVQVNCAAIPEELIESELFGHEKGSFTGAVRKQIGKFVAADGGTIFLDEIGDMSARTQAKVLRVLQDGEVEPVGASTTVHVDVRVVAATNRELAKEIEAGRFREDLYYRLNVIPVHTPPLRERMDDLPLLVEHFVDRFAREHGYPRRRFAPESLAYLAGLPWRGNVRELRNLVERLLILSTGDVVALKDVTAVTGGGAEPVLETALMAHRTLRDFREASEKLFLLQKLREQNWNVTKTAQVIETPRSNLYKKMEQYEIRRDGAEALPEEEP